MRYKVLVIFLPRFIIYLTNGMIVIKKTEELKNQLLELKSVSKSVGFVPTMGALHQGHISLIEQSVKENQLTVVSIFVNPTQFNNPEDLINYPRTEEEDLNLLKKAGTDIVFLPTIETIYPNGEISEEFDFNDLENQMEGKFRPGHFNGVGTVVKRFFEIIQPDRAYFGEKDFQQLQIISQMVKSLQLPVKIIPAAIKREKDGLAMSSRNRRLSEEMRKEAPKIYEVLLQSKSYLENHSPDETVEFVKAQFKNSSLELEYFEIADEITLKSVKSIQKGQKVRGFIAAFADDIRLIDNLRLN